MGGPDLCQRATGDGLTGAETTDYPHYPPPAHCRGDTVKIPRNSAPGLLIVGGKEGAHRGYPHHLISGQETVCQVCAIDRDFIMFFCEVFFKIAVLYNLWGKV